MALTRPITSPGKASSRVSRSWPNIDCAYFVANGRPVAAWVSTMPRSNRPEHTRTNAIRSRWAGSMLACTLNTSPENAVPTGRGSPLTSSRADGGGANAVTASSSLRTPKFGSAAPNRTGLVTPPRKVSMSTEAP